MADAEQLKSLPGIGDALAARIIAARPIESFEAMAEISGISLNTVNKFRDFIVIKEPPPPPQTIAFYMAEKREISEQGHHCSCDLDC